MNKEKTSGLKSSFELAIERLAGREGPARALTPEQKTALAEIDRAAKAKVAELEIMLASSLAGAQDDPEKVEQLKSRHQAEVAKIHAKAEADKERVRRGT